MILGIQTEKDLEVLDLGWEKLNCKMLFCTGNPAEYQPKNAFSLSPVATCAM